MLERQHACNLTISGSLARRVATLCERDSMLVTLQFQDHLREELQHYVKENARLQRKLEQQESAASYNVSGAASSTNPLHLGQLY